MNWRYADGTEVPLSDLTDDQLNECLHSINKRQVFVILKLKKAIIIEKGIKDEAKKRKLTLTTLDLAENPKFKRAYTRNKELIGAVQRSFTRKENQLQKEQD